MQYYANLVILAGFIAMVTCQGAGQTGGKQPYGSDPGGVAPVEGQSNVQGVNTGGRTNPAAAQNYPPQAKPIAVLANQNQRPAAMAYPQLASLFSSSGAAGLSFPSFRPQQYPSAGMGGMGARGGMGGMGIFMFPDMMQDPLMCRMMGMPMRSCLLASTILN